MHPSTKIKSVAAIGMFLSSVVAIAIVPSCDTAEIEGADEATEAPSEASTIPEATATEAPQGDEEKSEEPDAESSEDEVEE